MTTLQVNDCGTSQMQQRVIITKTNDILTDMDPATRLILDKIDNPGIKLVYEEGTEIVITPEDFKQFWKRVGDFTSSSMSGIVLSVLVAWDGKIN